jgi:hypothetical protein
LETAVGRAFTTPNAPVLPKLREVRFLTTDSDILPDPAEPTADWMQDMRLD